MTPEASGYLEKARQCLGYARINLEVGLGNDAGRNAYLAAFHAAKSHQGVHAEFSRLAKDNPAISIKVRRFLPQAYNLKAVADYELGPESVVPPERAAAAIEGAANFIECVDGLVV